MNTNGKAGWVLPPLNVDPPPDVNLAAIHRSMEEIELEAAKTKEQATRAPNPRLSPLHVKLADTIRQYSIATRRPPADFMPDILTVPASYCMWSDSPGTYCKSLLDVRHDIARHLNGHWNVPRASNNQGLVQCRWAFGQQLCGVVLPEAALREHLMTHVKSTWAVCQFCDAPDFTFERIIGEHMLRKRCEPLEREVRSCLHFYKAP